MTRARVWIERLRNRFWVLPALGIALAMAGGLLLPEMDHHVTLPDEIAFTGGPDTARATLQMIATVAVSVAGISFSVIVVALVLASQQLSPRVLRSFQRHPLNQTVLGVFLGTATFSLYVLSAVGDRGPDAVPEFSVAVAMLLAALSLVLFVLFLHHVVRSLNASAVIRRITADGHQAVDAPYPAGAGDDAGESDDAGVDRLTASHEVVEVRARRAGYLASVEAVEILKAADDAGGFVEQHALIGRFIVTGKLLARVWAPESSRAALVRKVEDAFVLNEERVVDHDVAFPIRQLADIALKGLSPGINDPTTAENAMDSVTDTLRRFACRPTATPLRLGRSGEPRLLTCALDLDALVRLGFDQVRRDGATRASFAVRLLELLADLRETGGRRAAESDEIKRQARLICEDASRQATVEADREFVEEAYRDLHAEVSPV